MLRKIEAAIGNYSKFGEMIIFRGSLDYITYSKDLQAVPRRF